MHRKGFLKRLAGVLGVGVVAPAALVPKVEPDLTPEDFMREMGYTETIVGYGPGPWRTAGYLNADMPASATTYIDGVEGEYTLPFVMPADGEVQSVTVHVNTRPSYEDLL